MKILLLGHTGKMGTALTTVFSPDHTVIGANSRDFDAADFAGVTALIDVHQPDLLINAVAFLGIDPCEQAPERAFLLNSLYPRHLATTAAGRDIPLVHFSTDAVFDDRKGDFLTERDTPTPLNLYGLSKYGGDCLIQAECRRHYLFRIPVLFGQCRREEQFVEKMLARIRGGQKLIRVSNDIVSSPSYSLDLATRVRDMLLGGAPYGLYHLANEGKASLYELMAELVTLMHLEVTVEPASFHDFPYVGRKNSFTPLRSEKTAPLRNWRKALADYCRAVTAKD